MKEQVVIFVDHVGRTVIGTKVKETDSVLKVSKPVIIHVQVNPQNNQLQVQSVQYLFVEFIDKEHRDSSVWEFNKSSIAISEVVPSEQIVAHYHAINNPQPQAPPQPQGEPEVIKLFSDE